MKAGSRFGDSTGIGLIIPLILVKFGTTTKGYAITSVVCCVFMVVLVFIHHSRTEERNIKNLYLSFRVA